MIKGPLGLGIMVTSLMGTNIAGTLGPETGYFPACVASLFSAPP
jgi:hypothetical protein